MLCSFSQGRNLQEALSVYESFGGPSAGFTDGSSWNTAALGGTFQYPAGLDYTDQSGNALLTHGTSLKVSNIPNLDNKLKRPLRSPLRASSGTYWVSYLIRLDSHRAGDAFWTPDGLHDIGAGGFQTNPANTFRLVNGGSTGLAATKGSTYFVVLQVGASKTSMWVNPANLAGANPGTAHAVRHAAPKDSNDAIFKFNAQNHGAYTLDELRIGTSYAAVSPFQAPRTFAYESFGDVSFGFKGESVWTASLGGTKQYPAGLGYTDGKGNVLQTEGQALQVSNIPNANYLLKRPLSTSLSASSGAYWVSYLIRLDSHKAGDAFWTPDGLHDIGGGGFQTHPENTFRLVNGGATNVAAVKGTTYFVVLRVGASDTSMWVNPADLKSNHPGAAQAAHHAAPKDTNDAMFKFNAQNHGAYTVDELRLGDSYAAVTPFVGQAEPEESLDPIYDPLDDAKCFTDVYNVPDLDRNSLYADYAKIFRWGLLNPKESPIFSVSENGGVTNNRFAGMCIRMAFHDNTIDPSATSLSAQAYVQANVNGGRWIGPSNMKTSGGDASTLICKAERTHPHNDYDKTASRVLHAFQTHNDYPRGPGIKNAHGQTVSLMEKYGISYADALQNCALAAITFLTENRSSASELPTISEFPQSNAFNYFMVGRLDACHTKSNGSREALCGNASILPGVTLSAEQINHWFVSRGMPVGTWLSLFGTHTTFDNFGLTETLRNVGVSSQDYFEDYVGCPHLAVKAPVTDPEDDGCNWSPQCYSGMANGRSKWPMAQSDCATGINILEGKANNAAIARLRDQMNVYIHDVGSWVPDCVCGLMHFGGGDAIDCVGPNAVIQHPSNSLFGSTFSDDVR